MNKKHLITILMLCLSLLFVGCASGVNGSKAITKAPSATSNNFDSKDYQPK